MRDKPIFTTDMVGFAEVLDKANKDIEAIRLANRMLYDKEKENSELRAALTLLLEKYIDSLRQYSYSPESIEKFPEVLLARKVLGE